MTNTFKAFCMAFRLVTIPFQYYLLEWVERNICNKPLSFQHTLRESLCPEFKVGSGLSTGLYVKGACFTGKASSVNL